ncbi:MAG TPA: flagellar biosynthetic protein FliR [Kofleriaceae bacterium]
MHFTESDIGAFVAVLCRVGGLAVTAPVIGDPGTSQRARLTFVLAVSAVLGPARAGVAFDALPMIGAAELAIGLVTGLIARIITTRVAIAGQLMGLSLGLGFASQYDVHAGESASVLRTLLTTLAAFAFLTAGGLEAIVRSAAAAPANLGDLPELGQAFVRHATAAFGHGILLAAPVLLASFVGNIALAVMNRAAPAVNVFSVALSAVMILGGLVLLSTAAHLVAGLVDTARSSIDVLAHPGG